MRLQEKFEIGQVLEAKGLINEWYWSFYHSSLNIVWDPSVVYSLRNLCSWNFLGKSRRVWELWLYCHQQFHWFGCGAPIENLFSPLLETGLALGIVITGSDFQNKCGQTRDTASLSAGLVHPFQQFQPRIEGLKKLINQTKKRFFPKKHIHTRRKKTTTKTTNQHMLVQIQHAPRVTINLLQLPMVSSSAVMLRVQLDSSTWSYLGVVWPAVNLSALL